MMIAMEASSADVDFGSNSDSDSDSDSCSEDEDRELREAFIRGSLKPGLNEVIVEENGAPVNRIADMQAKLREMRSNLPWVETLELVNGPAPMAPEMALQFRDTARRQINIRENNAKLPRIDVEEDPVLNEFKRETTFHRQAQASVVEGIGRLRRLGIVTKRPDIYFAEMAKTDDHMHKVRQNLMAKRTGQARAEKVRQLRRQKKMGKQIQAQTKLRRAAEKREALNEIKKLRKGAGDKAFSETKNGVSDGSSKKSEMKKKMKSSKFGFGGRKKGSKLNTKDSAADFRDYPQNSTRNKGKRSNKRLGKSRRKIFKSKNKK